MMWWLVLIELVFPKQGHVCQLLCESCIDFVCVVPCIFDV